MSRVWPVNVIKLRQNLFSRHKPVITCVCAVSSKLDYGDMIVSVVLKLVAVAAAAQ